MKRTAVSFLGALACASLSAPAPHPPAQKLAIYNQLLALP